DCVFDVSDPHSLAHGLFVSLREKSLSHTIAQYDHVAPCHRLRIGEKPAEFDCRSVGERIVRIGSHGVDTADLTILTLNALSTPDRWHRDDEGGVGSGLDDLIDILRIGRLQVGPVAILHPFISYIPP